MKAQRRTDVLATSPHACRKTGGPNEGPDDAIQSVV